jgi:hypothetical protein
MIRVPDNHMVEHFDFEKLPRAHKVAGDFDVRVRRLRLTTYAANGITGVIPHPVLCRMCVGFAVKAPCLRNWMRHKNVGIDGR